MSRRQLFAVLVTAGLALFLCMIVISYWHLWYWLNPVSVLMGEYLPLVRRVPDFLNYQYMLRVVAPFVAGLLALAIGLFTRWLGFRLLTTAVAVVVPIVAALFFQFCVALQLDKYAVLFMTSGQILFPSFDPDFDIPFVLALLKLFAMYSAAALAISTLGRYALHITNRT